MNPADRPDQSRGRATGNPKRSHANAFVNLLRISHQRSQHFGSKGVYAVQAQDRMIGRQINYFSTQASLWLALTSSGVTFPELTLKALTAHQGRSGNSETFNAAGGGSIVSGNPLWMGTQCSFAISLPGSHCTLN